MDGLAFGTGWIKFKEKSYEEYLEQLEKEIPLMFIDSPTEIIRIPPIYREKIMDYLKVKFPDREIEPYEISGIYIRGNIHDYMRYGIKEFKDGKQIIQSKFLKDLLLVLKEYFPSHKFEIQPNSKIYEGLKFKYEEGESIVVDDFEAPGKWQPCHCYSSNYEALAEKICRKVAKGMKIILTDHYEYILEKLRAKFPDKTFTVKLYHEVFPWLDWEDNFHKADKNLELIIVDGFVVPPPKKNKI